MPPFVSIIVPCYNEENTITHLLDAIFSQSYPRAQMEVLISDSISRDGTRAAIAGFQHAHTELAIRVLENSTHTIPSGLNQAIRAARGELIVRLDAHSVPIAQYVERCVEAHESARGDNVGGVWDIAPGAQTWIARAIARAASHPLGAGDALYRLNPRAGAVDTVPFGSFRRTLIDQIGGFDETLQANEDYEFNARLRAAGGTVWLDPQIRSIYFARATFSELAKQYWRYGFWKWQMLRRYPRTLRWRQALPPAFIAMLLALGVLSLWIGPARFFLAAALALYLVALELAAGAAAVERRDASLLLGLPLALATMHVCWGAGFLFSLARSPSTHV